MKPSSKNWPTCRRVGRHSGDNANERSNKDLQDNIVVEVSGHGRRKEQFDGLLLTETTANIIEIKYFSSPTFKREFIEAALYRASAFLWDQLFDDTNKREDIVFWLVVVVDFPEEALAKFREQLAQQIKSEFFTLKLKFYHIDDLKTKYGEQGVGGQPATSPRVGD